MAFLFILFLSASLNQIQDCNFDIAVYLDCKYEMLYIRKMGALIIKTCNMRNTFKAFHAFYVRFADETNKHSTIKHDQCNLRKHLLMD